MSASHPQPEAPEQAPPPPKSAAKIIVFDWPLGSRPQIEFYLATVAAGVAAVSLLIVAVNPGPSAAIVVLVVSIFVFFLLLAMGIQEQRRIKLLRKVPDQTQDQWRNGLTNSVSRCTWFSVGTAEAASILGLLLAARVSWQNAWLLIERRRLSRFRGELLARRMTLPLIIVDQRFAHELRLIELTEDLVEPEPIRSAGDRFSRLTMVATLLIVLLLMSVVWNTAALPCFLTLGACGLVFYAVYSIRWRTMLWPNMKGSVAGPGSVRSGDEPPLAGAECVTLIYRFRGCLRVLILGPNDRVLSLLFSSPRDRGFVEFWQRWNHPNPRPELLGDG